MNRSCFVTILITAITICVMLAITACMGRS